MRKMMTKEVTSTIVKVAKIDIIDGAPKAVTLPDLVLLGNVDVEKAQKLVAKKLGQGVSVLSAEPKTETYELPVEKFLEIATLKTNVESVGETAE